MMCHQIDPASYSDLEPYVRYFWDRIRAVATHSTVVIRRWVTENDWLDAIIALPDQLFYNTGIYTYIWIVTNRKAKHRRGKVQLIDATHHSVKMIKSLGNKRNELSPEQIDEITKL
jgi:type I restriction-modification system DNA methylase subunit